MAVYNISIGDGVKLVDLNQKAGYNSAEDLVAGILSSFISYVYVWDKVKTVDVARLGEVAVVYKESEETEIIGWGYAQRKIKIRISADVKATNTKIANILRNLASLLAGNSMNGLYVGNDRVVWVKLISVSKVEEVRGIEWVNLGFEVVLYSISGG